MAIGNTIVIVNTEPATDTIGIVSRTRWALVRRRGPRVIVVCCSMFTADGSVDGLRTRAVCGNRRSWATLHCHKLIAPSARIRSRGRRMLAIVFGPALAMRSGHIEESRS